MSAGAQGNEWTPLALGWIRTDDPDTYLGFAIKLCNLGAGGNKPPQAKLLSLSWHQALAMVHMGDKMDRRTEE